MMLLIHTENYRNAEYINGINTPHPHQGWQLHKETEYPAKGNHKANSYWVVDFRI